MQVISDSATLGHPGQPVCAAIGMFDGVHLGHQAVLQQAIAEARQQNGSAAAITFDRHPNAIVAPDRAPPFIQPLAQRLSLLAKLGIDTTLVLRFDEALRQLSAAAFVDTLCRGRSSLSCLCVGESFTFGHQRSGNVPLLRDLGRQRGFLVHAVPHVCVDDLPVRSTRIREQVRQGNFANASRFLGRPYSLRAPVLPGDQLGRQLGFPTANLDVAGLALPPNGVYAARAIVGDTSYPAVLNIGFRPTLAQTNPQLRFEVHLLDFTGDLYHQELEVLPVQTLRPELTFPNLDALRAQIQQDVQRARTLLAQPD